MTATQGTVRRPSTGQSVAWVLAPCLQREASIAEATGLTVWSIGNANHLLRSGGHTPWRTGSPFGIVWAIDVMVDNAGIAVPFEKWLITYLKSDVDTTWIRFVNVNGSQYDSAGNRLASSADHHFHLEIRDGKQNAFTTLFASWRDRNKVPDTDFAFAGDGPMVLVQAPSDPKVYATNGIVKRHVPSPEVRDELLTLFGQTEVKPITKTALSYLEEVK